MKRFILQASTFAALRIVARVTPREPCWTRILRAGARRVCPAIRATPVPCHRLCVLLLAVWFAVPMMSSAQSLSRFSAGRGSGEQHTTVAIKADGSSVVTNNQVTPRAMMEQSIRTWEVWQKRSEGAGDDDATPQPPAKPETKPFTDAELAAKIRETARMREEQAGAGAEEKIESIEIKTNTVRTVTTRSFASLSDLLGQGAYILGGAVLQMENIRFETTNGQLRVTLSPSPNMQRYAKTMRQQWKNSAGVSETRFIFPGKVLTSGLPNVKDNTTWISIDGQKSESIDALLKLYDGPAVIICELGGLKVDAPLESKSLQRIARRPGGDPAEDLPIIDAGPGFLAEGASVTTSTTYLFPEGEKHMKDMWQFSNQQTGTVVRAKLFPPKGRTFHSVSGMRVTKAVDDKGREIPAAHSDANSYEQTMSSSGNHNRNAAATVDLRLQLPASDAASISELAGEAVAVTIGTWKEFTITNLQANATNEIDLSSVLPGAKIALTKVNLKNRQMQVEARIKGDKAIRQLDVQLKQPGNETFNSYSHDRNFSTKGVESTRLVNVQAYSYGQERGGGGTLVLVVRSPEDMKRERVRFALKDLDLF